MSKHCYLILTIIFFLICCMPGLFAQDSSQSAPVFLVGTFVHLSDDPEYTRDVYDTVLTLGVNSVFQTAVKNNENNNLNYLTVFPTVSAANDSGTGTGVQGIDAENWQNIDWISYFTQAKYMKWEAEGDPELFNGYVQIKQEGGEYYQEPGGIEGWKTNNQSQSGDSIIYGPHYWQYPRYTFSNPSWNPDSIIYKAIFRLKIDSLPENSQQVCQIMVTSTNSSSFEKTLAYRQLATNEFDTGYNYFSLRYSYSGTYDNPPVNYNYPPLPGTQFSESSGYGYNQGTKVQFKVVWLGNRELFVDYIEVYDEKIWDFYFNLHPTWMVDSIINYNQGFATLGTKLKYYTTMDEPGSIDCYEPLRKVQSILDSLPNINADLLTHWYPYWNGHPPRFGGDLSWPIYNELAQPKKLYFWYAPFTFQYGAPQPRDFTLNNLRMNLQWAHLEQPGFYIAPQTFGIKEQNGDWYIYMTPTPAEVGAETMLSLAHGVEGIYYELYYSYCRTCERYVEGLVNFPDSNYAKRDIWFKVQELASRLRGKLGQTLMTLDYRATNETDGFLRLYPYPMSQEMSNETTGTTETKYYLTLSKTTQNPIPPPLNFHVGFFDHPTQTENNYFLLANLITTDDKWVNIGVTDNGYGYENMRFRNIEPEYNLDTTFTDSISIDLQFAAGEGYLYQVAPVVKYGGRLIYDEEITSSTTLLDEMTIENGAELSLSANYTCFANIIVKDGEITRLGDGKLIFKNGFKLIIEGTAELTGTTQNKLEIDFSAPLSNNGILIDSAATLNITYCKIKSAETGIKAELYANSLVAQYVDFIDCGINSINILGQTLQDNPPQVKYCTISNSQYGISAANLPEIIIQQNKITDTELGIYLSNVTNANIVNDTITSSLKSMPGIFLESCNGILRGNTISGHTSGIHLGNSSPDIGGNYITNNLYHGIYIGYGSLPNMEARLYSNPPIYYAISGYNDIKENGGTTTGGPFDNDGSEIFFSSSNVLMQEGCNSICDDRSGGEHPFRRTKLLMNGIGFGGSIVVHAEYNYWCNNPLYPLEERFGNLIVYYEPVLTGLCDFPGGGGEGLLLKTSGGEIIDTIYSIDKSIGSPSNTDLLYASAEEKFITADYESAEGLYNQIVNGSDSLGVKLQAYRRLYEIGKLNSKPPSYFSNLYNEYASISQSTEDSLLQNIFKQLASLSLVGQDEYVPAIGEFDNIVQQNPGSEEAVYAEIDALTTALLVEGNDSTLNKGTLGKYLVKTSGDYFNKINGILRKNFGSEEERAEKEIIPKEYTLYQNYPNPFNPITTIKYDLPKVGEVKLVVYDILGRKVKTLVNQTQQAGRYDIQFDASSLASGVYIYQLRTKEFINSKKMILLK